MTTLLSKTFVIHDEKYQKIDFFTTLPKITDDKNEFSEMKIKSEKLGGYAWRNGSASSSYGAKLISYDHDDKILEVKFKDY